MQLGSAAISVDDVADGQDAGDTCAEMVFSYETRMTHSLDTSDGVEQETCVFHSMVFERPDGTAEVSVALTVCTTDDHTTADAELNATWNNQPFATRQWRIA